MNTTAFRYDFKSEMFYDGKKHNFQCILVRTLKKAKGYAYAKIRRLCPGLSKDRPLASGYSTGCLSPSIKCWELDEQLMLLGLMVTLDSIFNCVIQNWRHGKITWIFANKFYLLFRYKYSADFFYHLYKRIRKYYGFVTRLTQNVEELEKLLNISENQLSYIINLGVFHGLIRCSGNIVPFENNWFCSTKLYQSMSTAPGAMVYLHCRLMCGPESGRIASGSVLEIFLLSCED